MIHDAPVPNFWRGITDNDAVNKLAFRSGKWQVFIVL